MKRFRYALDPLCLLAGTAYGARRWLLPLSLQGPFLRGHFSDLLLIPAALPPWLWVERRLALREHDGPPTLREIALHVAVWSLAAEAVAPLLFARATGDIRDVAAYVVGAALAAWWWHRP